MNLYSRSQQNSSAAIVSAFLALAGVALFLFPIGRQWRPTLPVGFSITCSARPCPREPPCQPLSFRGRHIICNNTIV